MVNQVCESSELVSGSFRDVFTLALDGHECRVIAHGDVRELPVHSWQGSATGHDHALLDHCRGATLDIGCGPGRLAVALAHRGHPALGIDIVASAVDRTVARGGNALLCNVFDAVPGEGTWTTALLADGNIGIGGEPLALLRRVKDLLDPYRGRVVAEVCAPGIGVQQEWIRLSCGGHISRPFRWAQVGADAIPHLAADAGFGICTVHRSGDRWWAVLEGTA